MMLICQQWIIRDRTMCVKHLDARYTPQECAETLLDIVLFFTETRLASLDNS